MTVASVTKVTNDKGDNEKILGAVHISTGIWLTVEENSKKTSARRDRILILFSIIFYFLINRTFGIS